MRFRVAARVRSIRSKDVCINVYGLVLWMLISFIPSIMCIHIVARTKQIEEGCPQVCAAPLMWKDEHTKAETS